MVTIPTLPNAEFWVPSSLQRLVDLAYNLWWSWHAEGRELWSSLDPVGWEQFHNPIELLSQIDRTQWRLIEQVEAVHDRYAAAVREFDKYLESRDTWYDRQGVALSGPVAYLCTEFGIHSSLPFYSGGLGILAGDHTKSASDLGIPFVGVGLLYRRGYFRQEVGMNGNQQHIYPTLDLRRLPVQPVAGRAGGQLKVTVELPDRDLAVGVWKLNVGTVPLLLLDTDLPENHPADRPISHQLYVAGREMRFCQELVLGIGAVRALSALGIEPSVWHVNEGHAAMSILERTAVAIEGGATLAEAQERIRRRTIFTLHTPVPAGNEVFNVGLADKYLRPVADRLGLDIPGIVGLAAAHDGETDRFDLGALAIRFASKVNGVSKRHGEIVSQDWRHLIDGDAAWVTNGVHTPTWIGRAGGRIMVRNLGRAWPTRLLEDPSLLEGGHQIGHELIWDAHQSRKEIFVRFARRRLRRQMARHGGSPDDLRAVDGVLNPDWLTLGFARRFATYKRATLMFTERERFRSILTDPDRPVQVVFAGKAHPADQHGQAFIKQIKELSESDEFRGHVHVLEDYDARMARFMVQGVDVWVNTPRPPMEASGTSGMKAAINGTLNLSILDGWWLEGYNGKNGWAFGSPEGNPDWGAADYHDAGDFYEILGGEVIPLFYDRNEDGLPLGWTDRMRESIIGSIRQFSTHRMVADYWDLAYRPMGAASD